MCTVIDITQMSQKVSPCKIRVCFVFDEPCQVNFGACTAQSGFVAICL